MRDLVLQIGNVGGELRTLRRMPTRHVFRQHTHRRQRRAELVRGAGAERSERHDALVAQRILAGTARAPVALAQGLGKRRNVVRDQRGADHEDHHMPIRCSVNSRDCASASCTCAVTGRSSRAAGE